MGALHDGAGMAPLRRAIVRIRGDRPLRFLHDTTSQDLLGLVPGRGALTCLLDEGGRVLAEARVLPLDERAVLLDGEPAAGAPIVGRLGRVAPLASCDVADESEAWEAAAVRGPRSASALDALGALPPEEHGFVMAGAVLVVRVVWGPPGYDVLAPRGALPAIGAEPVPARDMEAARIAAGRPAFGADVTEDLLVNETPLLGRAVSFTKGCYPGQESVARVRNLGRVRRTLVGLRLDGDRIPEPGEAVLGKSGEVGRITSAGALDGEAAAIALVRAEVGPGDAVTVGGATAVVRALS